MKIAALADVKAHLSAYVDECENEGPVIITRNGKAAAILLAPKDDDDLERLMLATRAVCNLCLVSHEEASKQAKAYHTTNSGRLSLGAIEGNALYEPENVNPSNSLHLPPLGFLPSRFSEFPKPGSSDHDYRPQPRFPRPNTLGNRESLCGLSGASIRKSPPSCATARRSRARSCGVEFKGPMRDEQNKSKTV